MHRDVCVCVSVCPVFGCQIPRVGVGVGSGCELADVSAGSLRKNKSLLKAEQLPSPSWLALTFSASPPNVPVK